VVTARQIFELQLERVHLRALRAVVLHADEPGALERIEADLTVVDQQLTAVGHDDTLPMRQLVQKFELSPLESDFVWMAVAMVADPRLVTHGHAMIGSAARRGLPLSLYAVFADLDGPSSRELALALGRAHPLRQYQLLEAAEPTASEAAVALRASSRLVSFLAGTDEVDDALLHIGGPLSALAGAVFDEQQQAALRHLTDALSASHPMAILIEGPSGAGRRTAAATAAGQLGQQLVALDLRQVQRVPGALEEALVGLRRECLFRDAIPVLANIDDLHATEADSGSSLRTLAHFLDNHSSGAVLTSSRPGLELHIKLNVLRVDWPVADTSARRKLWTLALGANAEALGDDLDQLSLRYRLGPEGIARAHTAARLIAPTGQPLGLSDLITGVRNNIAEHLGSLAKRIEVSQTWDDLILAPDIMDQIHTLIARVRHAHTVYEDWGFRSKAPRGIGVPALFSGPPGTGKTMVAGIIARELNLELLQVDLSQVVSKWIGETEKQLSRVFDAAEAGHALLLFDEADALFAKRTEVKGATDRYANLEVNYLLQRVESFGGITILTTNLESSIDKALKRRLASHIVFWPPEEEEREQLWRRLLTTGASPISSGLDLEALAHEYSDMTGANIRNAVLAAAFLAASESAEISQEHLERAARGEYRTMGRVLR